MQSHPAIAELEATARQGDSMNLVFLRAGLAAESQLIVNWLCGMGNSAQSPSEIADLIHSKAHYTTEPAQPEKAKSQ